MLAALDAMVADAQVYDIETPDTTYEDYDLVRYNYRTSDRDVTLLGGSHFPGCFAGG
jgi:hypothetical protein